MHLFIGVRSAGVTRAFRPFFLGRGYPGCLSEFLLDILLHSFLLADDAINLLPGGSQVPLATGLVPWPRKLHLDHIQPARLELGGAVREMKGPF